VTNLLAQIITLRDTDALGDLDIGQKRTLVCRELKRTLGRMQNMADTLLCMQEPSLVTCSVRLTCTFYSVSRNGATTSLETHHVLLRIAPHQ
jgi:hypothetical protein